MKIKPEPGKVYRIWSSRPFIPLYEAPHMSRGPICHIENGSVVIFLGFHPSTHLRAQVLYGEKAGWVFIPRDSKIRKNFWRPVRC